MNAPNSGDLLLSFQCGTGLHTPCRAYLLSNELLHDSLRSLSSSLSGGTSDGYDALKVIGGGNIRVWIEPCGYGNNDVDDLHEVKQTYKLISTQSWPLWEHPGRGKKDIIQMQTREARCSA